MCMSQTCVDVIFDPSAKLIERGRNATRLLATLAPSIINMDVAPVSAMACLGPIVFAGNVGNMSATCRRHVDLSPILTRHVCRGRHTKAK
jgi:hypothetical protein